MQMRRWGANRNSGSTVLIDQGVNKAEWSASRGRLKLTVYRVTHDTAGQFNFAFDFDMEEVALMLGALSDEAEVDLIAEGLQPALRDLMRLQAAAAGLLPKSVASE